MIVSTAHLGAGIAAADPVHSYRGVVPVLCYHGIHDRIDPATDPYSITRAELVRQLTMLRGDGFQTISIAQYARFAAGDPTGLPERPILLTFDDGRVDSYRAADPILASFGMRATMFVITANAAGPKPGYLGWPSLAAIAASGRWDIQEHAHAGHVMVPTGPGRQTGPYYANLVYRNGTRERFTAFKRRVSADILTGRRLLAARIPGFKPIAFAPPYDSYGQVHTNYGPIPGWESAWLKRTFKVLFVQDRRIYNLPGNPIGQRYGIRATTTSDTLHRWLIAALPRGAWTVPPVALSPRVPALARPRRPSLRRLRVGRRHLVMVFRRAGSARLGVTRRRAGKRRRVRVAVSRGGRLRDARLRPGAVYVYRAIAVDPAGHRSRVLRLRVRTAHG